MENGNRNNRSDFIAVLRELHQMIRAKDKKSIFANPVTESQAPNYFKIIEKAMDLQTISDNIESYAYSNALGILEDVIVMCQNALVYNTAETVYYKIALQMLKYAKRLFGKDSLQRLADSVIFRLLSDEEIGDVGSCLRYLKSLHLQAARLRPGKSLHREVQDQFAQYRTRPFIQTPSHEGETRRRAATNRTEHIYYEALAESALYYQSDEVVSSQGDVDMSKDEEKMSEPIKEEESTTEEDENVLETALAASKTARAKLVEKYRRLNEQQRVLYLTNDSDNTTTKKSMHLKDQASGEIFHLNDKVSSTLNDIKSIDINANLMEGVTSSFTAQHLCYSPTENVSLTTSRPLHLYCVPEQAVFVETFGDVATAEYACNMHYFVKGLPRNSLAVKTVKNRLNACTNYLTFGVDQIIMKRLKNMPPTCMD